MPTAGSCTICEHPSRASIEAALQSSASLRSTANQFGIGRSTISRHLQHTQGNTTNPEARELMAEARRLVIAAGKANDAWQAGIVLTDMARLLEKLVQRHLDLT